MSQPAAVEAAKTKILQYNIEYTAIALLYYDYSLTWTSEVKYFWTRKPSLSTVLYFFCRYALVANVLYTLAIAKKLTAISCDAGYQLCSVLSVFGRIGILTVWGARTYAVFDKNKFILAIFVTLGLMVIVLSVLHVPFSTCVTNKNIPLGIPPQLLAIMTAIFEVLSTLLTTARSYRTLRLLRQGGHKKEGLTYLIVEQGLLYFAFVSLFSVGTIVLFNIQSIKGTFFERLLNALTIPISGMMTCRFLIHLRDWERKNSQTSTQSVISKPIEFNMALPAAQSSSSWSQERCQDPPFDSDMGGIQTSEVRRGNLV